MTREEVQAIVHKHLCQAVEGLTPEAIDASKSMKELGANSLDIVEVVSAAMREMKIKIPRAQLGKLTNIDGLVDLLHTTHSGHAP